VASGHRRANRPTHPQVVPDQASGGRFPQAKPTPKSLARRGTTVAAALSKLLADAPSYHHWPAARALVGACGSKNPNSVSALDVASACERWAGLAASTRLSYNTYLRRCLALIGAPFRCWEGIPHVKSPAPRQVTVSAAEFEATLRQADIGTAFFLLVCRDCALRSGTAIKLTLANFMRPEGGQLMVSARTKNGGWVSVPVSSRLAALVESARALGAGQPDASVVALLSRKVKPSRLGMNMLSVGLKKAQARAGTGGWTWHDLRRSAAHALYKATGDLRDVRDLLGHHNLGSSLVYLAAQQKPIANNKLAFYASGNEDPNASKKDN
jgi:integrase